MKKVILAVVVASVFTSSMATAGFSDRNTRGGASGKDEAGVNIGSGEGVFNADFVGTIEAYCGVAIDDKDAEHTATLGLNDIYPSATDGGDYQIMLTLVNDQNTSPLTVVMEDVVSEASDGAVTPIDVSHFSANWGGAGGQEFTTVGQSGDLVAETYYITGKVSDKEEELASSDYTMTATFTVACPTAP